MFLLEQGCHETVFWIPCILHAVSKGLDFTFLVSWNLRPIALLETVLCSTSSTFQWPAPSFSSPAMLCSIWLSQFYLFVDLFRNRISVFSPCWKPGVYYLNPTFPKPFSHSAALDLHLCLLRLWQNLYLLIWSLFFL